MNHFADVGKTNPTCRGVLSGEALAKSEALAKTEASGEAGTNPISKGAPVLRKRFLQKLLSAVALAKADARLVRKLAPIILSNDKCF